MAAKEYLAFYLFDDTDAPGRSVAAPAGRLYPHKSNTANERLADGLSHGRVSPWSNTSGQRLPIPTALATMRKKTRLAAMSSTINLL